MMATLAAGRHAAPGGNRGFPPGDFAFSTSETLPATQAFPVTTPPEKIPGKKCNQLVASGKVVC